MLQQQHAITHHERWAEAASYGLPGSQILPDWVVLGAADCQQYSRGNPERYVEDVHILEVSLD